MERNSSGSIAVVTLLISAGIVVAAVLMYMLLAQVDRTAAAIRSSRAEVWQRYCQSKGFTRDDCKLAGYDSAARREIILRR